MVTASDGKLYNVFIQQTLTGAQGNVLCAHARVTTKSRCQNLQRGDVHPAETDIVDVDVVNSSLIELEGQPRRAESCWRERLLLRQPVVFEPTYSLQQQWYYLLPILPSILTLGVSDYPPEAGDTVREQEEKQEHGEELAGTHRRKHGHFHLH